jgi:antitoxin HigA-1
MKFVSQAPVHPGQILSLDFMEEHNLTVEQLSANIGVSVADIDALLTENAPISADMALRLSRHFGNSVEFWLNLQRADDLSLALKNARGLDSIRPVEAA